MALPSRRNARDREAVAALDDGLDGGTVAERRPKPGHCHLDRVLVAVAGEHRQEVAPGDDPAWLGGERPHHGHRPRRQRDELPVEADRVAAKLQGTIGEVEPAGTSGRALVRGRAPERPPPRAPPGGARAGAPVPGRGAHRAGTSSAVARTSAPSLARSGTTHVMPSSSSGAEHTGPTHTGRTSCRNASTNASLTPSEAAYLSMLTTAGALVNVIASSWRSTTIVMSRRRAATSSARTHRYTGTSMTSAPAARKAPQNAP